MVAILAVVITATVLLVHQRAVNGLVNHLTLGLLVAVILLMNVLCLFILFILFCSKVFENGFASSPGSPLMQ